MTTYVAGLLLVLTLAVGAPPARAVETLPVTGAVLVSVGEEFITTAKIVTDQCNAKRFSAVFCNRFKVFEGGFKAAWPHASGLWRAAYAAHDPMLQVPAASAVRVLAARLRTYRPAPQAAAVTP